MRQILVVILVFCLSYPAFSQGKIKKKRTLNENVFFGGTLGFQFGDFTGIEIAPMAGYKPIDNMYTGVKLTYQYISAVDNTIEQNIYGGSLFAEYIFFDKIIGHAELETLNVNVKYTDYQNNQYTDQFWYTSPIIGGGLYQKVGYRSALIIMALFDVSGSPKSVYNNPIIRVTFLF